jgi:hypothetical protein
VGAIVAAHVLSGKVKTDEHLPSRPSASIGGFPFLTQALHGNYSDVTVTAHNLPIDGVEVTTLTANLLGVHLPFSQAVHGSVSQVPVDKVDGSALLSFANVNNYLASKSVPLRIALGSNGTAMVTDHAVVHGKRVSFSGVGAVTVRDSVVHVSVATTSSQGGFANRLARFSVPLQDLPFHLNIQSVVVTPTGLYCTGAADKIVLGAPPRGRQPGH